ncbi:Predicted Zn-dependent peptidase [Anaerobranca californiensis DSM 14826]|jgi:predicted Zn-dependent peptidase|uniref:Predicted Zn-dependent peptidase n=1 Tax=Anaerobranca californiensis DSM 14826 TaxID=1120989 RepID=A0A1M6PQC3_9FIRM|nr:pitrilysin family protein [Anaerobranca californiensis]SHK10133.1 Predicted Zn-dependent peptidase [Anaerobranca californiensis DSM 14826]
MAIETFEFKEVGEKGYRWELDNGLTVFYLPKPNFKKTFGVFAANYGAVDFAVENYNFPPGIAHFLEHKLFEEPHGNIEEEFAKLGVNVNAFTTHIHTCYFFSATGNFYTALELLLNFVQAPHFTEENVKKEQGIIAQEIEMYRDDPNWVVYLNLLKALYPNHPVSKDIAGTIEDIMKITPQILYQCYNRFYNPHNMVLLVAGDLDLLKLREFIEENQKGKKFGEKYKYIRNISYDPFIPNKKLVEEKMEVARPILCMGFKDKDVGQKGKELFKKEIATLLLMETILGRGSKLYNNLYDEGIIDSSFGVEYTAEDGFGHTILSLETDDPLGFVERLELEINKIKEQGLDKEEFILNKRKLEGLNLMELNSMENVVLGFMGDYFRDCNYFDRVQVIREVTFEDVQQRLYEHFDFKMSAISIINNSILTKKR